jgi:hypothetical protein
MFRCVSCSNQIFSSRCEEKFTVYKNHIESLKQSPYATISRVIKRKRTLDSALAAASSDGAPPPNCDVLTFEDYQKGCLTPAKLRAMSHKDRVRLYQDRLLPRIRSFHPALCDKIYDMLFELTDEEIVSLIYSNQVLSGFVVACVNDLDADGYIDSVKNNNKNGTGAS